MIDFRGPARAVGFQLRLHPGPDRLPRGDPRPEGPQGARAPGDAGAARLVVVGRGHEARDHQLPLLQAGAGRAVLRAHLRPGQGLGVPLREVQADPLSRRDLRPLRRRGDALEGAARADGAHRARGAGGAHLVLQDAAEPDGEPARHHAAGPRAHHLLHELRRDRARASRTSRRTSCWTRTSTCSCAPRRKRGRGRGVQGRHRGAGGPHAARAARRGHALRAAARRGGRRDVASTARSSSSSGSRWWTRSATPGRAATSATTPPG